MGMAQCLRRERGSASATVRVRLVICAKNVVPRLGVSTATSVQESSTGNPATVTAHAMEQERIVAPVSASATADGREGVAQQR